MIRDFPGVLQTGADDCGDAVAASVCAFHGVKPAARLSTAASGLDPMTLEAVFWRSGLSVTSGIMTLPFLKFFTSIGMPVACPVRAFGGHWVVVTGAARGKVYYFDPAGGPRSMKASAWVGEWFDVSRSGREYARWGIATARGETDGRKK